MVAFNTFLIKGIRLASNGEYKYVEEQNFYRHVSANPISTHTEHCRDVLTTRWYENNTEMYNSQTSRRKKESKSTLFLL